MTSDDGFDYGELLVVQHAEHTGPGALSSLLDARAHRRPWRLVDAAVGAPFPALDDVRGILVLGGPLQVGEDLVAWLGGEINLLRTALEDETPVFGIGLGAQLLAAATGGTSRGRESPRIGYFPLQRTAAAEGDEVFAGWVDGAAAAFANDEEVTSLPDGAEPMLRLDGDVVAWRAPDGRSYGVEFHPEATGATIAAWTQREDYRERIAAAGTDPDDFAAEGERRDRFLRAVGVSLVGRWVDQVVGANDPDPARGRRARS